MNGAREAGAGGATACTYAVRSFLLVKRLDGAWPFEQTGGRSPSALLFRGARATVSVRADLRPAFGPALQSERGGPTGRVRIVTGDASEVADGATTWDATACAANALQVDVDLGTGEIEATTSITGLPPLFSYADAEMLVLTSDLFLLREVAGLHLRFDLEGVVQLGRIGHPVDGRTLFRGVRLAPGGHVLRVGQGLDCSLARRWCLPGDDAADDPGTDIVEEGKAAFLRALSRMDTSRSILSLTGGLDSRAVLAGLMTLGRTVPAYTMSGPRDALDAMTASGLCAEYSIPHTIVRFDQRFAKQLPECVEQASLLSGGLTSIDDAHEVYFYRQIDVPFGARLSGAYGTQVIRLGTARLSMRNADLGVLDAAVREQGAPAGQDRHWYSEPGLVDGKLGFGFVLQKSVPFSGLANYGIGNFHAVQQSPYVDRAVVEVEARRRAITATVASSELSMFHLRWNALAYRIVGLPRGTSFQCRLIRERGGALADWPINWGWRARGGCSVKGLALGSLAFLDIVSRRRPLSPILPSLLDRLKVPGMNEIKDPGLWVKKHLREFVADTLLDGNFRLAGVADPRRVGELVSAFTKDGTADSKALVFALDLALAARNFRSAA